MKSGAGVAVLVVSLLLGAAGLVVPLALRQSAVGRLRQAGYTPVLGQSALVAPDELKPCAEVLGKLWRVIRNSPMPEGESLAQLQKSLPFERAKDRCGNVSFTPQENTWMLWAVPSKQDTPSGCKFFAYASFTIELSCPKTLFYPGPAGQKKRWKPGQ